MLLFGSTCMPSHDPIWFACTTRLPSGQAGDPSARDRPQGSTWGGLFGAAGGQGGGAGGLSPSRNHEVKKAIRAAMAFGLPRGGGGKAAAAAGRATSPNSEGVNGSRNGAGIGEAWCTHANGTGLLFWPVRCNEVPYAPRLKQPVSARTGGGGRGRLLFHEVSCCAVVVASLGNLTGNAIAAISIASADGAMHSLCSRPWHANGVATVAWSPASWCVRSS